MSRPTSGTADGPGEGPRRRGRRRVERPATGGRRHELGDDELAPGRDDDDLGWGSAGPGRPADGADRWLEEQRPPHWG